MSDESRIFSSSFPQNYTVGLFLLISTGGFPCRQKCQMRYFQCVSRSFLYLESRTVGWGWIQQSFQLFWFLFRVMIDIHEQRATCKHVSPPSGLTDTHTHTHTKSKRVVSVLLCCVSLVSRRSENLALKANMDEARRPPHPQTNLQTTKIAQISGGSPCSCLTLMVMLHLRGGKYEVVECSTYTEETHKQFVGALKKGTQCHLLSAVVASLRPQMGHVVLLSKLKSKQYQLSVW